MGRAVGQARRLVKVLRNGNQSGMLQDSTDVMHPVQLLCTPVATGSEIMHPTQLSCAPVVTGFHGIHGGPAPALAGAPMLGQYMQKVIPVLLCHRCTAALAHIQCKPHTALPGDCRKAPVAWPLRNICVDKRQHTASNQCVTAQTPAPHMTALHPPRSCTKKGGAMHPKTQGKRTKKIQSNTNKCRPGKSSQAAAAPRGGVVGLLQTTGAWTAALSAALITNLRATLHAGVPGAPGLPTNPPKVKHK